MSVSVIVLAAGKGTRMRSRLPKVLQPLGEQPMLGHVLSSCEALEPEQLCVVIGHGAEAVQAQFAERSVSWVMQSEQLGTGHAVQQALPELDDEAIALVTYGDIPLIQTETLRELVAKAKQGGIGLLTIELANSDGYGRILRNEAGEITGIVEHKDATAEQRMIREVNTGILAAKASIMKQQLAKLRNDNAQGEYYLTDLIALAYSDGLPIYGQKAAFEWEVAGINDKIQLADVERQHQLLRAQALMRAGATLRDPARLDIRGELSVAADVEIDVNCVFHGQVSLGEGVVIGPNCVISDSQIEAGTVIAANSVIESASVGPSCQIGPFARLRPGTVLLGHNKVGNFVELKKARIDQDSKVNHLSYIGDASLGKRVNIGAGTITCNYDGVNKHQTDIKDDVFIGSNTQIVAPVTIHQGALVGAGSSITRDVDADTVVFSKPPLVSKPRRDN